MNVQSYTILHYGADYVGYALRSIYDHVSKAHIIYTPHPTHGHDTDAQPPETRDQLLAAVLAYDPDNKIKWHEVRHVTQEHQHRNLAVDTVRQARADMLLVVDCDEVWDGGTLARVLDYVWKQDSARDWLVNFTSLWRSFGWVCRDDLWPVRVIDFRHGSGIQYVPRELGEIYHFGYAVRDSLMRYKWRIHGHKAELRDDWFENRWDIWPPPDDCHPTNDRGFWNPEPFDRAWLPALMREHPFYELERIE